MARAAKKVKVASVVISQTEIEAINSENLKIEELSKQLNELKKATATREAALMAKLSTGACVEQGPWIAAIDKAPGRCTPSWKDEAVLLAVQSGQAAGIYEETVKAKYPPKMKESLVITKIA